MVVTHHNEAFDIDTLCPKGEYWVLYWSPYIPAHVTAHHRLSPLLESVAVSIIIPSSSARSIAWVLFASNMSMEQHVTAVAKSAFCHLKNTSRNRIYISFHTTEILKRAFVTSRLDFGNSVLYGIPQNVLKRLQSVQNAAARVVTLTTTTSFICRTNK